MGRRGVTLAAATLTVTLGFVPNALAGWLAGQTPRAPSPSYASDRAAIATNAAGDMVLAYGMVDTKGDANTANDEALVVAAYRPAGGPLGGFQTIATGPSSTSPEVQASVDASGAAIVAFTAQVNASTSNVQVASRGAGGAWTPARNVSTATPGVLTHGLRLDANPRGDVALFWLDSFGGHGAVGTTTGSFSEVPTLTGSAYTGDVAIDPAGNVSWAWERDVFPRYLIEVRDKPAGAPLSATTIVSPNADDHLAEGPAIDLDSQGRAVVAYGYRGPVETTERVRYNTRSSPGGNFAAGTWNTSGTDASAPGQVTNSYGTTVDALPDSTTLVTYQTANSAVWTARRQPGQAFGGHQPISDPSTNASSVQPGLGADGSAIVAFATQVNAVQASVGHPTTPFGSTLDIDPLPGSATASQPAVAVDGAGNAFVAYVRAACPSTCTSEPRLVFYDAVAPRLDNVSIPATAGVGVPVAFAAQSVEQFPAGEPAWTFGDGAAAGGGSPSHTYEQVGAYAVQVSATDAAGQTSTRQATVQVTPAFELGKLKLNKKKGTATLAVTAVADGALQLSGKNLKSAKADAVAGAVRKLAIKPKGKLKRKLKGKGKAKAKFAVVFEPAGGQSSAETGKAKLKLAR